MNIFLLNQPTHFYVRETRLKQAEFWCHLVPVVNTALLTYASLLGLYMNVAGAQGFNSGLNSTTYT